MLLKNIKINLIAFRYNRFIQASIQKKKTEIVFINIFRYAWYLEGKKHKNNYRQFS